MPWHSIPWDEEHRRQTLKARYGICELPTLVVIGSDGTVITHDGRQNVVDGLKALTNWAKLKAA